MSSTTMGELERIIRNTVRRDLKKQSFSGDHFEYEEKVDEELELAGRRLAEVLGYHHTGYHD